MRVHTDDEIYRVNAVWLGPAKATFPWRARYVAWGIGIVVFIAVFAVARKVLQLPLGFFVLAWSAVITVVITRWIGSKINHERPVLGVLALWFAELRAPRRRDAHRGSAASTREITVRAERPRSHTATSTSPSHSREEPQTHA